MATHWRLHLRQGLRQQRPVAMLDHRSRIRCCSERHLAAGSGRSWQLLAELPSARFVAVQEQSVPSRERLGLPAVPIGKRRRGLPQIHWLTGERLALGQQVSRRLVVAVGQAIQAFSVLLAWGPQRRRIRRLGWERLVRRSQTTPLFQLVQSLHRTLSDRSNVEIQPVEGRYLRLIRCLLKDC